MGKTYIIQYLGINGQWTQTANTDADGTFLSLKKAQKVAFKQQGHTRANLKYRVHEVK